jgi:hypothetical protein
MSAASFAPASGAGALDLDPISRDLLERASGSELDALPPTDTPWNFISQDAEAATTTEPEEEHDPELERYLVQEIARASRRRPLMKRLERVESAYAELPGNLPASAGAPPMPPPLPSLDVAPAPASPAFIAPIDQLMEQFGENLDTDPPPSAEWLETARRERRQARHRTAFAWIATLAIGAAIIAATMQALQA